LRNLNLICNALIPNLGFRQEPHHDFCLEALRY
jgi:hypothetical protein